MSDPKIIIALDYDNADPVIKLVKELDPGLCRLKIGKELFTSCGPDIVKQVQDFGFDVFLDLKFHDIPATVAKACKASANLGVWMLNVHALGGSAMLRAAVEAIGECNNNPLLIAVTLLTSHAQSDLEEIGIHDSIDSQVLKLAKMAKTSGLNGVVCSAKEAGDIRQQVAKDFICVTPGIRPAGSDVNDQKRVVTPQSALAGGSSYLVIGRPITQAVDPKQALMDINSSITK